MRDFAIGTHWQGGGKSIFPPHGDVEDVLRTDDILGSGWAGRSGGRWLVRSVFVGSGGGWLVRSVFVGSGGGWLVRSGFVGSGLVGSGTRGGRILRPSQASDQNECRGHRFPCRFHIFSSQLFCCTQLLIAVIKTHTVHTRSVSACREALCS